MNSASISRLVRVVCAAAGLALVSTGATAQPGVAPTLTLSLEEAVARASATR